MSPEKCEYVGTYFVVIVFVLRIQTNLQVPYIFNYSMPGQVRKKETMYRVDNYRFALLYKSRTASKLLVS